MTIRQSPLSGLRSLLYLTITFLSTQAQDLLTLNLNLHLYPDSQQFTGTACWTFLTTSTPSTDTLYFHLASGQQVIAIHINGTPATWTHNQDKLIIIPASSLPPDTHTTCITYRGGPWIDPSLFGGIYFTPQLIYTIGVGLQSVPHSLGRAWLPCQDTFTEKFTGALQITIDTGWTVLATGMPTDTVCTNTTCTWHYQFSFPIPVYLLSFAAGKWQTYKDSLYHPNQGWIPYWISATSSKMNAVPGTFQHVDTFFRLLTTWLGNHYFPRVGFVIVPLGGAAMEHPTNIAISSLLVNGTTTYELVLAHELAHHWIGDLVTLANPQEMWWQEGGPSFFEYRIAEELYGLSQNWADTLLENLLRLLHHQDGGFLYPDSLPQQAIYGHTAYRKGALLWHALRLYLTSGQPDSLFFACLQNFFQQHAWENIHSAQFLYEMEQCAQNLGNTWVHPGTFHHVWVHRTDYPAFYLGNTRLTQASTSSGKTTRLWTVQIVRSRVREPLKPEYPVPVWLSERSTNGTVLQRRLVWLTAPCTEISFPAVDSPSLILLNEDLPGYDATLTWWQCFPANTDTLLTLHLQGMAMRIRTTEPACIVAEGIWAPPPDDNILPSHFHLSPNFFWRIAYTPGLTIDTLTLYYNFLGTGRNQFWTLPQNDETNLQILYRPDLNSIWQSPPAAFQATGSSPTDGVGAFLIVNAPPGLYILAQIFSTPDTNRQPITSCIPLSAQTHTMPNTCTSPLPITRTCSGWIYATVSQPTWINFWTLDGQLIEQVFCPSPGTCSTFLQLPPSVPIVYQILDDHALPQLTTDGLSSRRNTGLLYTPECQRQ